MRALVQRLVAFLRTPGGASLLSRVAAWFRGRRRPGPPPAV